MEAEVIGLQMPEPDLILKIDDDSALGRALGFCEIHCDRLCCGMNAFELSPAHLSRWANEVDAQTLQQARTQLTEVLEAIKQAPELFDFLDGYHRRADVQAFFTEIQQSLSNL